MQRYHATGLVALGGAVAAWPLAAHAQQTERLRRIGVLMSTGERDPETQLRVGAFREGLQKLVWAASPAYRDDIATHSIAEYLSSR